MHWKITALWGGKKVELRETQRAVTPFGGLVVFFEFLRQVGYREAVSSICRFVSLPPTRSIRWRPSRPFCSRWWPGRGGSHTPVCCVPTWPCTSCWGSLAFRSTTPFAICSSVSGRDSASVFSPACGIGSWSGCRNVRRDTVWIWTPRCSSATAGSRVRCADPTRASMDGPRIIRWWRCWPKRIFCCTAGCAAATAARPVALWNFSRKRWRCCRKNMRFAWCAPMRAFLTSNYWGFWSSAGCPTSSWPG